MAQAPASRLDSRDFYIRLDWLRDNWANKEEDEAAVTMRLSRLKRLFEHLPTRYWLEAEPALERIGYLRLSRDETEARNLLAQLRLLVSKWDRSRPPLLECPVCTIGIRGHSALTRHRQLVHGDALE